MTNVSADTRRRAALAWGLVCAVALLLIACTPAWALTTDKTTARGTNSSGDAVLGGTPTRFTWEGTVGDDEELAGLRFTFPEGTEAGDGTSVKATVLDGLTRLDVSYAAEVDDEGASVTFDEPVASGLKVRVEIQKLAPPARTMEFTMGLYYTDASGEEVQLPDTPAVDIVEQGVVENIVSWLEGQRWVAAWNSNTFLRLFLNPIYAVQAVPNLFVGWLRALGLVLIGFPLAIPLGFCLAFMRMSGLRLLRGLASLYVNVVRGTPLFLQIYIAFFGLPLAGVQIPNFPLGVVVLAMNSSAYLCEIFRAGIQSIPKGQFEASRSLGMNGAQTMLFVIIPQTVRRVIPTMTSEFILLYKDTSMLAAVGVMEVVMYAKTIVANTGSITPYIVAACFYLVITLPLAKVVGHLENKLAGNDAGQGKKKRKKRRVAAAAGAVVAAANASADGVEAQLRAGASDEADKSDARAITPAEHASM